MKRQRARRKHVFPLLPWCTEATHDEVAYAKRESSPRYASPALGEKRALRRIGGQPLPRSATDAATTSVASSDLTLTGRPRVSDRPPAASAADPSTIAFVRRPADASRVHWRPSATPRRRGASRRRASRRSPARWPSVLASRPRRAGRCGAFITRDEEGEDEHCSATTRELVLAPRVWSAGSSHWQPRPPAPRARFVIDRLGAHRPSWLALAARTLRA